MPETLARDAMTINEALLAEAAACFPTGSGATELAAVETIRALLKVSEHDARVLLSELVNRDRLERRVHRDTRFVTIWRPSGKVAHKRAVKHTAQRTVARPAPAAHKIRAA
jgi:hypothetical protein